MSKVCFLTVQWLEEARYTADNLLIAKMMSDYGQPLDPNLQFFVKNSNNDSSLFFEAIKKLFTIKSQDEDDVKETLIMHIGNKEIDRWIQLTEKIRDTSMYEAFRMVRIGLESQIDLSSDYFDGTFRGTFTEDGLKLEISGTSCYMLYYEFLEGILQLLKQLKKQLPIWEGIYNEYTEGSQRNSYHAS